MTVFHSGIVEEFLNFVSKLASIFFPDSNRQTTDMTIVSFFVPDWSIGQVYALLISPAVMHDFDWFFTTVS